MKRFCLISFSFLCALQVFSQQRLSIQQCEELFQANNLTLLAEHFNIDVSKAAVIQAKIWDLPYVSGEANLYNPPSGKFVDAGNNGQKAYAVQQLIYLGRKKKKEVDFAKNNVQIAELQYEQLARNLRLEIRQNFYELYFNQEKVKKLNLQLSHIDTLVNSYSIQAQKGNVPLKDVVRLRALSLSFKNEIFNIQKEIFSQQERLKILINSNEDIITKLDENALNKHLSKDIAYTEDYLQNVALEKNLEYRTVLELIESSELMLKWQKSLAIPDITMGVSYDQRGGAFNNQTNFTFAIPLALWNRNKGNIKQAEAQFAQSKILKQQKELELKSRISMLFKTLLFQQKQYYQTIIKFQSFDSVYEGMLLNFQRRNISLIEFADFMESYTQSILFINEIKKELIVSFETMNYMTNDSVF